MGKRSEMLVRFWAMLAVISLTSPAMVYAARVPGYLEVTGPTPLRFQVKPPPLVVVPETNAPAAVVEAAVPPPPATSAPPVLAVTLPDAIKTLLAPLWANLAESALAEWGMNFLKTPPTPEPVPEPPAQTVTAEMLADFFKSPAPNANTNAALPGAIFVLPSSQATYRTTP